MTYGTVNADVIQTSTSGGILGAGNASIMKNRIINGAMVIDQRNAGALVNPMADSTYYLDRWRASSSQTSKLSIGQNAGSVTPPVGFVNYMGFTSLSAYSITSGDIFGIAQNIEGYNVADLGWGTANAKTVTLSFQVYSSLTGTFGGSLRNSASSRSYPFSYTVSSANTWTPVSITIAGDTSGTWLTTNGIGIILFLSLGSGSTYSGTAGSWSGSTYTSATGATSVVGTNGATFYITGVQLEVGSSATGFEYVNYQTSLANCQRYYWKISGGVDSASAVYAGVGSGVSNGGTTARIAFPMNTQMRTSPTISFGGTIYVYDPGVATVSSISTIYGGRQTGLVEFTTSNALTSGHGAICFTGSTNPTDFVSGSAEL